MSSGTTSLFSASVPSLVTEDGEAELLMSSLHWSLQDQQWAESDAQEGPPELEFLHCVDDLALEQIVQVGRGVSLIGDIQETSGHRIRVPALLGLAKTLEVIQSNTSAKAGSPRASYTGMHQGGEETHGPVPGALYPA